MARRSARCAASACRVAAERATPCGCEPLPSVPARAHAQVRGGLDAQRGRHPRQLSSKRCCLMNLYSNLIAQRCWRPLARLGRPRDEPSPRFHPHDDVVRDNRPTSSPTAAPALAYRALGSPGGRRRRCQRLCRRRRSRAIASSRQRLRWRPVGRRDLDNGSHLKLRLNTALGRSASVPVGNYGGGWQPLRQPGHQRRCVGPLLPRREPPGVLAPGRRERGPKQYRRGSRQRLSRGRHRATSPGRSQFGDASVDVPGPTARIEAVAWAMRRRRP